MTRRDAVPFTRVEGALALALLLSVGGSCRDSLAPLAPGDLVIVGGDKLVAVSVSRGEVVARIGPIPEYKGMYALTPDSSRLYLSSADQNSPVSLSVVDTRSLRVVAQEPMSVIGARSTVGPMRPVGSTGMAVSPDGRKLIMNGVRGDSATWLSDSAKIVVILDRASLTPVAWVGPLSVPGNGIVPIPGNGNSASQRVLVVGARPGATVLPSTWIYVLGGPNLTLLDSLQPGVDVWQVVPLTGGQAALLLSTQTIYRLDLTTRELVDSGPNLAFFGTLCLSQDGQRSYLTDPGNFFDYPGSGKIRVYDQALRLLAPIDLGSSATYPPTLNGCAVSRDGRFLFVSSGTSSVGPTFPPQPGRLFVVDRSTRSLVRTVDIGSRAFEVFAF